MALAVVFLVIGSGWAVRSAGIHYLLNLQAARHRYDWAVLPVVSDPVGAGRTDAASAELVRRLRASALAARFPPRDTTRSGPRTYGAIDALGGQRPGRLLAFLSLAWLGLAFFDRHPFWPYLTPNLSEAAATHDAGEVARLLASGQDPNAAYVVRGGLLRRVQKC